MSTALQDLETLRIKAGAMASLASSLNAKLSALESTTITGEVAAEPEEATFIRSSLARLGLPTSAVTLDMVRDEEEWKMQLARELAGVLQGFDEKGKGKGIMSGGESIIGLDEVWCGWNRARGVGVSPSLFCDMVAGFDLTRRIHSATPTVLTPSFPPTRRTIHKPTHKPPRLPIGAASVAHPEVRK